MFCDNYLDGGYHVPFAHADLASDLNVKSYNTTVLPIAKVCRIGHALGGSGTFEKIEREVNNDK